MLRPAGRGSLLLVDATASANIGHVRRNMHEFEPEPKLRRGTSHLIPRVRRRRRPQSEGWRLVVLRPKQGGDLGSQPFVP